MIKRLGEKLVAFRDGGADVQASCSFTAPTAAPPWSLARLRKMGSGAGVMVGNSRLMAGPWIHPERRSTTLSRTGFVMGHTRLRSMAVWSLHTWGHLRRCQISRPSMSMRCPGIILSQDDT